MDGSFRVVSRLINHTSVRIESIARSGPLGGPCAFNGGRRCRTLGTFCAEF
jgi:hypothetical protein